MSDGRGTAHAGGRPSDGSALGSAPAADHGPENLEDHGLRVALLGPLQVWRGSTAIDVSSNRLRTMLAALALSASNTVTVEQLAFALWPDDPPAHQRRSVQTYVSRLRRVLGPAAIRTVRGGYRLDADPDDVDVLRFHRLLARAAASRGTRAERERLEEALALWRGAPFGGLPSSTLCGPKAVRLVEQRLSAVERWIDLGLAEGRHNELVAEVQELALRHPLREPLWERLLLTLGRCGRQAEALAMYERLRHRLADDLGVDPSPELQRRHLSLLADEERPATSPTPCMLPVAVAGFAGRDDACERMDRLFDGDTRICVVSGTAGVGKTALVLHWAHRARAHFPDGQLYVDLRGFGPSAAATSSHDALPALLTAMGVPPQAIPAETRARAALYRTVLAGKRMLVVLDDARDAEQVRRLLPGDAGCAVVVTSRQGLSSLVASEGAALLTLDVLTREEARDLLARRLGRERIATDPAATDEIIELCARLPLALAIVAGRAVARPLSPMAALAADLRRVRDDLGVLATKDSLTDMRAVLARSYDALPPDAARLFRLLAVHPGPDVGEAALASLAGLHAPQVSELLDTLLDAHLVGETVPSRFSFHELLRTYARGLARAGDTSAHRRAVLRTIEHYLHTTYRAALLLDPAAQLIAPDAPAAKVRPEHLRDRGQAQAWFRAERVVLFRVIRLAMAEGLHPHVVRLALAVTVWCDLEGDEQGKTALEILALEAAGRSGDHAARGRRQLHESGQARHTGR
ncbi:AfsR/SARP family transcriptional regulator [Nonomuraea longispora]|uniref:AfsR/SARP family transcriptional regulator n=2 Tax=Nonomuraea longispora TaxID=1848320 RepID=A0A4V2XI36_9ACTN|nr:AfsR/SARP family transcriptional regulator [Nonomuraea longispora]